MGIRLDFIAARSRAAEFRGNRHSRSSRLHHPCQRDFPFDWTDFRWRKPVTWKIVTTFPACK